MDATGTTPTTTGAEPTILIPSQPTLNAAPVLTLMFGKLIALIVTVLMWEVMDATGTTPTSTPAVHGIPMTSPLLPTAALAMVVMAHAPKPRLQPIWEEMIAPGTGPTKIHAESTMAMTSPPPLAALACESHHQSYECDH